MQLDQMQLETDHGQCTGQCIETEYGCHRPATARQRCGRPPGRRERGEIKEIDFKEVTDSTFLGDESKRLSDGIIATHHIRLALRPTVSLPLRPRGGRFAFL